MQCGTDAAAFNDDTHILVDYMRFGWSLKVCLPCFLIWHVEPLPYHTFTLQERIEKTLAKIDHLEEAHKVKMKEYRS